ncbi:hypothetical protein C8A00DRAFT_37680 [Chaetomidium leptoderma]|uniref:NACHT domain-containing protein n=1 Tax=Chaetomidium leptoderma TaxID=669021 RepID=A0AAN6VFT4_9PEZI|nr:hypothetical protein C8A00DRAFT_37680 [Chaetomidium leptoderma]
MKFLSDHPEIKRVLKKWAGPKGLQVASHYFWNQGFELQKSQRGLLRTILFHILKNTPNSVPAVCPRLPEDDWKVEDLKTMLRKVVKLDHMTAKSCFLIDGLDKYHGDEEELVDILSFFSDTLGIKLCVSSRPRLVLDEAFAAQREHLVISDFTKNDMKTFVRTRLQVNPKFRKLQASRPACEQIMAQIAETSNGVWLWVYLVTHDLVRAVNRNEGIPMLRKILDQFPRELEEFFRFIIESVRPSFREEMAHIFLITIDEVQPLPLFVFSLFKRERSNADYTIASLITPLDLNSMEASEKIRKDQLQNRYKDLLVVERGSHPVFLSSPVDFLHRTVRDFLRDCYYDQLKRELTTAFDPLVSLCNAMLFLVKGLPAVDIRQPQSITRLLQLVDELLYYAYEIEKRQPSPEAALYVARVLDELDRVNRHHTRHSMGNHWTHIRDPPRARGLDEYREGGNYNFLALAVQARLTGPAGRCSTTRSARAAEAGIDLDMVRLLLERGANPNQPVHLNDGKTVWALFLLACLGAAERVEEAASPVPREVLYRACELLIRHGAEPQCWFGDDGLGEQRRRSNVVGFLDSLFGGEKSAALRRLLAEEKARRESQSWGVFSWFSGLVSR